jgi:hypothetical protein
MNEFKVFMIVVGLAYVVSIAADVGKERAKTMAECYKAAQVNINIKCEDKHE